MPLNIDCPLCNSKKGNIEVITKHVYGGNGSAFYKCSSCEVIFQFPGLSDKEEKIFYKKEFEKFMDSRIGQKSKWQKAEDHIKFNIETKIRRKKYLDKFLTKKTQKILEVGCSSGFMMYDLIKKGHTCHGIEPSGIFSKFLKKKKIKLFKNLNEIKKKNNKYDLVMHFFVLEHIKEPISFLKDQLSLLKDKGKIIFEVPSYEDALHKVYDIPEFERFYWSVAHPWYFNLKSLKYLLKKTKKKFSIIKHQRYDLSNHLYWMKFRKPGGMSYYSKFLGLDIETKYKNNLITKGYYDTLIGIIKN